MSIMDSLYVKSLCPSCIEEFYVGDCRILSRATTGLELKPAPKGLRRQYARRYPEPLTGREYASQLACRECPHCKYLLPYNIELVEQNIIIAVVGNPYSGKSHYIAALIHQIKQGLLHSKDDFGRFTCLTEDIEKEYTDNYFVPLFTNRKSLLATPPASDVTMKPLIYELTASASPTQSPRSVNLIIYDTAGTDFVSQGRLAQFARFVLAANAIIFLADPLTMPQVFNRLPLHLQKPIAQQYRSSDILTSTIAQVERYHDLPPGARLFDIPIAVALSKSDLLKYLNPVSSQYTFTANPSGGYTGGVNLEEVDIIDHEVREVIDKYGERPLLQATNKFSKVKFFATSATGQAPNSQGNYDSIDPCRCLDPMLWILYELGLVGSTDRR